MEEEEEEEDRHNTSVEEQGMDKGKALVASDTAAVDDREKIQLVKDDYVKTIDVGNLKPKGRNRRITSHVREASQSSMAAFDGIMEALTHGKNINTIGVCGSDSTETADLIEKVSRRAKRDKLFDVIVMATVSHKPNNNKIQEEIAETLGLKFDGEKNVTERAKRLRERLQMEHKVLVILHDLCKGLDLDKVGIPSSGTDSSGCMLLLTSASEELLLNQMFAQQIFKV